MNILILAFEDFNDQESALDQLAEAAEEGIIVGAFEALPILETDLTNPALCKKIADYIKRHYGETE